MRSGEKDSLVSLSVSMSSSLKTMEGEGGEG